MNGTTQLAFEIFIAYQGTYTILKAPESKKGLKSLAEGLLLDETSKLDEETSKAIKDMDKLLGKSKTEKFAIGNLIGVSLIAVLWSIFSNISLTYFDQNHEVVQKVSCFFSNAEVFLTLYFATVLILETYILNGWHKKVNITKNIIQRYIKLREHFSDKGQDGLHKAVSPSPSQAAPTVSPSQSQTAKSPASQAAKSPASKIRKPQAPAVPTRNTSARIQIKKKE